MVGYAAREDRENARLEFLQQAEVTYSLAAVDALPVSSTARRTLRELEQAPLGSVAELSGMYGRSVSVVHRGLTELGDSGFVLRMELGGCRSRRSRFCVSPDCMRLVGPGFGLWHDEWALARVLERLPVAEGIYEAVGAVPGLGPLRVFQWFGRAAWDAAALFERGWAMFVWAGLWHDERRLRMLMGRLGEDMVRLSVFGDSAWPAVLCFVVHDAWERELVFRAARREGLVANVGVYCLGDRRWAGEPGTGSRGWVSEYVYAREVVLGMWDRRVAESVWNGIGGEVGWRGMLAIAEWDRISWRGLRAVIGESRDGRRTHLLLRNLMSGGYVERVWERDKYRYSATEKMHRLMGGLDRMRRTSMPAGYGRMLDAEGQGIAGHEDWVLDVMGGFMSEGKPTASGWRSWEHLGGGGGIAPDGIVMLDESPFGPGWHYVECERRAQGRVRIGRKLRGYVAEGRQDDWPVLVVVPGEGTERTWWEVGGEMGARFLTATPQRMRAAGGVFGRGVWKMAGEDVTLG